MRVIFRWRSVIISVIAMFVFTLFTIASLAETAFSAVTKAIINAPTASYFDLPEPIAACLDDSWQTCLFVLPNEWNRGELLLEESNTFPMVCLYNNQTLLVICKKNSMGEWNLDFKNPNALCPRSAETDVYISLIDSFHYDSEKLFDDGYLLPGSIRYTYKLSVAGQEYLIQVSFQTRSDGAGWIFDTLQVIMPQTAKSTYLNGAKYNNFSVTNITECLQYSYALDERPVGSYNVSMSEDSTQLDASSFDIDRIIEPSQCFTQTKIDTSLHGNGRTLNLRSSPGGSVISKIPNNSDVVAANLSDEWILVVYGKSIGYVDARFVKGSSAYDPRTGIILADTSAYYSPILSNGYTSDGIESDEAIATVLDEGMTVRVLLVEEDWVKIAFSIGDEIRGPYYIPNERIKVKE